MGSFPVSKDFADNLIGRMTPTKSCPYYPSDVLKDGEHVWPCAIGCDHYSEVETNVFVCDIGKANMDFEIVEK